MFGRKKKEEAGEAGEEEEEKGAQVGSRTFFPSPP